MKYFYRSFFRCTSFEHFVIFALSSVCVYIYKSTYPATYLMCALYSVAESCQTLCDPMDCSPPGSTVHRIIQARIPDWVAMPSSRGSSQPRDQTCTSCVSCIIGGFFTHGATWEAHLSNLCSLILQCLFPNKDFFFSYILIVSLSNLRN